MNIFKPFGLRQLIQSITRPNRSGGTCIDWIVTNSDYIRQSGVYDIYISDHLPVYCIKKKAREHHRCTYRMCRDLSNYDNVNFCTLLRYANWAQVELSHDMCEMWDLLYKQTLDILAIMCPFKKYKQRENVSPWMSADIYKAMRLCDKYISLFRASGCQYYLELTRRSRNRVNQIVNNAKSEYIRRRLRENNSNPRKFWRIIDRSTFYKFTRSFIEKSWFI